MRARWRVAENDRSGDALQEALLNLLTFTRQHKSQGRTRALDADERTLDSVIAWFVKWRRLEFTIVWRGTPGVDDWVAYIAKPKSKRLILVDGAAERRVKNLLARLQTMPKRAVDARSPTLIGAAQALLTQDV